MVPDTCTVLKLVVFSSESRAPLARCLAVDPRSLDHLASTAVALMPWEMYCKMTASTSNRLPTASASRSGVGFPHVRLPSGEAIALTTGTRQAAGNGIVTLQSPKMPPLEALKPCHIGLRRVVRAAGGSADRAPTCQVAELVILLKIKDDTSQGEADDVVNAIWSLQYSVPGCVCGSGGTIVSQLVPTAATKRRGCEELPCWTHAVHIRLGSLKVAELFLSRPEVTAALKAAGASCERIDRLLWGGEVASDLFAMFRQGEGWAEGVEHMLFIAENESYQGAADAAKGLPAMVRQLGEVAEKSRAGSLQSVQGAVQEGSTAAVPYMLMARFPTAERLEAFTSSPPYQAVWEASPRLPGQALTSVTFSIAPSEEQSRSGISSGFL